MPSSQNQLLDPDFDELGGELVFAQYLEPTPEAVSYPSEDAWRYRKRYWRRLHPSPRKPYKPRERKPAPEQVFEPAPAPAQVFEPAPASPQPRQPKPLVSEAWLQARAAINAAWRKEQDEREAAYELRRATWSNEMLTWNLDGKSFTLPKPTRGMGLGTGKYLFVYADEFQPAPGGGWRECARQDGVICLTCG